MNDISYIRLVNSHTKCYRCHDLTDRMVISYSQPPRRLGAYHDVLGFHKSLLDIRTDVIRQSCMVCESIQFNFLQKPADRLSLL